MKRMFVVAVALSMLGAPLPSIASEQATTGRPAPTTKIEVYQSPT